MPRRFLLEGGFFVVSVVTLFVLLNGLLNWGHQHFRSGHDPNALYLIGDSRIVYGVDRARLAERTHKAVHGYIAEGAGTYAVYAFTEHVPDGATVLVAPTLGMFMKPQHRVQWNSSLSLRGILLLIENDFTWWAIKQAIGVNRNPLATPHMKNRSNLFDVTAEPAWNESEDFVRIREHRERPEIYAKNQVVFRRAIESLLARNCRVKLIDIPVTARLRALGEGSIYGPLASEIEILADKNPKVEWYDGIELEAGPDENLYWDFDHLNALGAKRMTDYIVDNVLN